MEESKKVDLTFLMNFAKGNKAGVVKYIDLFIAAAPAMLQHIEDAVSKGDGKGLYIALHTLKPQLQFMGINTAFNETIKIEAGLKEAPDVTEDVKEQAALICSEVMAAIVELKTLKSELT